jgi:hypothetical protein
VLLVGGGRPAGGLPQTLQVFCEVPVAVTDRQTTRADVAAAREAAARQGRRLVLLSPVPEPELADGPLTEEFAPVVDEVVSVVALSLTGRPDSRFPFRLELFLAPAGT